MHRNKSVMHYKNHVFIKIDIVTMDTEYHDFYRLQNAFYIGCPNKAGINLDYI